MLTSEAYAERKWASFPALRRVLEGKPLASDQWRTSIDESPLDTLDRLSDVAALAVEHRAAVWDAARAIGMHEIHTDIERRVGELNSIVGWYSDLKRQVQELHGLIEHPEKPVLNT